MGRKRKKAKTIKDHGAPQPKQEGGEKESTNRHVYIEPGAKIDFVQDLREKYDAAQGEDKTHKDDQLFWTKVASGLLLLAAVFSGLQWRSTKKAADAAKSAADTARDTLVLDQRPWIGPVGNMHIRFDKTTATGGKLMINLPVKNTGLSPAVRSTYYMEIVPFDEKASLLTSNQHIKEWCDIEDSLVTKQKESTGVVMFPGDPHTLLSPGIWDMKDTWITKPFVIAGCIVYLDEFKNSPPHHTWFCYRSYDPVSVFLPTTKPLPVPDLMECGFWQSAD
jgi:hypothetical protein